MKKVILLLFLIAFSLTVGKVIHYWNDGFSARRIYTIGHDVSSTLDSETDQILSQPFHYLGRGRQCFAFESDDGRYVLKFPRTDIYRTPFWVRALPVTNYRKNLEADHAYRRQFILTSFNLSYHELRDQTGLIALHLGQTEPTTKKLTVYDKRGYKHILPLESTSFVLQHKHPILMKVFTTALENNERDKAKRILDAFIQIVTHRAQKGILNRDRSFLRNYGFDGEKAYQIDVGSFFCKPELSPAATYQKSIRDSMDPVQEWLAKTDPEMLAYLNEKLNLILN